MRAAEAVSAALFDVAEDAAAVVALELGERSFQLLDEVLQCGGICLQHVGTVSLSVLQVQLQCHSGLHLMAKSPTGQLQAEQTHVRNFLLG